MFKKVTRTNGAGKVAKMKNLNEVEEIVVSNELDAIDLIEAVEANDIWQRCYTNELKVFPLENLPLFMDTIRSDNGIGPEVSDNSMEECMKSLSLGLKVPFSSGLKAYPLGDTAFGTLMQRAGFQSASVLNAFKAKVSQTIMTPENKAGVLNLGLECFANKSLVLIRDEKIRAVLSGDSTDYSILPFGELNQTLKDELRKKYRTVLFQQGIFSHEMFVMKYRICEASLETEIRDVLSNTGILFNNMEVMIRLSSSDVGNSCASIHPFVTMDGRERLIGKPLSLTHKNNHCINDFKNKCQGVFAIFSEAATKLEEMSRKRIAHPKGLFLRIAKQVGLPKKLSCEEAENFVAMFPNPMQIDAYWKIYETFDTYAANSKMSQLSLFDIEEGIVRTMFTNMEVHDIPFEWE